MKAKLLLFFVLSFGLSNWIHIQAQLSDGVKIYISPSNNLNNRSDHVSVVFTISGVTYVSEGTPIGYFKDAIKENNEILSNPKLLLELSAKKPWFGASYIKYDTNLSTSKRDVYSYTFGNNYTGRTTAYLAFSEDRSNYIRFQSGSDNRTPYIEIDPEDLKPKAVNYDFLNE